MIKISIIIPVYNVEKYVGRCLESCVRQELDSSEFEIIVINDGSPDKSLEMVEHIGQIYNNILIISQANQGLSVARNEGLKRAKGEYVWFVDSDDWIEENCISHLYEICKKDNLDILQFGAYDFINDLKVRRFSGKKVNNALIQSREQVFSNNFSFPVCLNLFKRDFLIRNKLMFMPNIMHEDNEFTPRAFYYASNSLFIEDAYYNVFQNMNSITRSVNPKKAFDLIKVAQSHMRFIEENQLEGKLMRFFCDYIGLAINAALENTFVMNKVVLKEFYNELNANRIIFHRMKKSNIFKYKIEAFVFLFSSKLFKFLYYLIKNR